MNEWIDKTVGASRLAWANRLVERLANEQWPRAILAACGMALLLSTSTALGTASLPFFGRTAYWLMEMLLGAGVIGVVLWLIRGVPRHRLYLRTTIVALVGTPLITLAVWLTTEPIKGHALIMARTLNYLPGVLPVTCFNAIMQIMLGRKQLAEQPIANVALSSQQRTEGHSEIYAIEAQAHYSILHTTSGPVKKLVRFYDAIESTARTTRGMRVHRSWWVAYSAVDSIDERQQRVFLKSGLTVPVSRANRAAAIALFKPLA